MTDECDYCCTEKPDVVMRYTQPLPVWNDGVALISWEWEAVCSQCFDEIIDDYTATDRRMVLEKNRKRRVR